MKNSIKPINFSTLNSNDRTVICQILELYHQVDKEIGKFIKFTKVHCPPSCGYCCATAKVETTPLEMLPLAFYLWSVKKGDFWLKKFQTKKRSQQCAFFKPHANDRKKGRCGVYALRPLICRLFGFSLNKSKDGGCVYGGCKIIKKKYPKMIQKVQKLLANDPRLLKMTDFSIRLFGIGPTSDRTLMPMNQAAATALEKIGFILEKQKSPCKM